MSLEWKGDEISRKIKRATAKGCYDTAEIILTKAKENAPVQTGILRDSGTLAINEDINAQYAYSQAKTGEVAPTGKSDEHTKNIYISFNTPYAYRQHEDTSINHTGNGSYYSYGGKKEYIKSGGAKYLEKAWNEKIKDIEKNIKAQMKKEGLE